jgi:hypothetical protein
MVEDPELLIRRMARFCDIPLDDELLALTLEHSSRPFMLEHKDRFDDAMIHYPLSSRQPSLLTDNVF